MQRSITSRHRARRPVLSALAIGVLLSLAPVATVTVVAKAPASAVTGLARGARGESVRAVQQALVNQGMSVPGGVDGIFGSGTEAALKQFQKQHGLPRTGIVSDATALELGLASSPLLGLTQGVRGAAVVELQQKLMAAGVHVPGGADGVFGSGTAEAVKQFQKQHSFSPTGQVDASTAAALAGVSAAGATSTSSNSSALVGLKIGIRGSAVKKLQRKLIAAGFTVVGGADGVFGVLTSNALRSFQNANGLSVTGVVDEATGSVLAKVKTDSGTPGGASHDPTVTSSPLLGLKYGSLGSDVKALQQTLIDAGVRVPGGADGVFGLATQAALKTYQAGRGLEQTGRVDEATANALASAGGSGAAGSSPLVGLKYGSLGNTVKQLQEALIKAGVTVRGGADGIFGPATTNAVKDFQKSQGLDATGSVDTATAAALANPKPVTGGSSQNAGGYAAYGEKGARVISLQSALVRAGVAVRGGVDGDFGAGTSAAVIEFQRAKGLSVTGKVDDATAAALGLQKAPAPAAPDTTNVSISVFPVQGRCAYGDSWGYARSGGRTHLGVDIIAQTGKLLYAVESGTITKAYYDYPGSLAGNGLRLTRPDGTYYFYAHLAGFADGIGTGSKVKAGQILGTVGNTGNAGTAHLHFEVHPRGGSAVNPYPIVKAVDGCSRTEPLPQG